MNTNTFPTPLISIEWLASNLDLPGLVILDASSKSVTEGIRGAIRFDFDKRICDRESSLPHMMPTPPKFESEVRALGINNNSSIVVYDNQGIFSSPRAYWMFKSMGHKSVSILEGGLQYWKHSGHATEEVKEYSDVQGDFTANFDRSLFCDSAHVSNSLSSDEHVVIDVRSQGRFVGQDPEPRKGLRMGHMPGARNIPFGDFLLRDQFRSAEELESILNNAVQKNQRIVFSCGSGVTACIGALAAEIAGYTNVSVYDGSWSEWGLPGKLPVTTC